MHKCVINRGYTPPQVKHHGFIMAILTVYEFIKMYSVWDWAGVCLSGSVNLAI